MRVFYDRQATPAIEMPLMDFLGDIQCQSDLFNTVYMTKVKHSHNFRLPLPFRKHITMNLTGYAGTSWPRPAGPADPIGSGHCADGL